MSRRFAIRPMRKRDRRAQEDSRARQGAREDPRVRPRAAVLRRQRRVEPARHAEDVPRLHQSLTWATQDPRRPRARDVRDARSDAERVDVRAHQAVHHADLGPDRPDERRGAVLRDRPRGRPHQGRPRAVRHDGAQHRRDRRDARPGDARHRRVVRAGPRDRPATSGIAAPSSPRIARRCCACRTSSRRATRS